MSIVHRSRSIGIDWLANGPIGPYVDAFKQHLTEGGYAAPTCVRYLAGISHFARWASFRQLDHDVHSYYGVMSMLAFPSIAPETFGRVSVEAQAAGVPVLASNIGGIPETLDPGVTGLLLPPGDVGAWRDAILQMCDPSRRLPGGFEGVCPGALQHAGDRRRVHADAGQRQDQCLILEGSEK